METKFNQKYYCKTLLQRSLFFSFILFLAGCSEPTESPEWIQDPAAFVDPFIGTEGEKAVSAAANTVPGAGLPFGMLNFGPECSFSETTLSHRRYERLKKNKLRMPVSPGGYNYAADRVKGFSLTRISGTGCVGASGDIPFLPFTNEIKHSPDTDNMDVYYSAGYSHANETARPGYYQVQLDNGVNVELSATERTGIARFTYPEGQPARLLVRTSYSQLGSGHAYTEVDIEKGEISGYVVSGNFCGYLGEYNRRDYYTLYFCAKLNTKILETGGWEDDKILNSVRKTQGGMPYGDDGFPKVGKGSGLWVNLDISKSTEVTMKVGISYVSIDNARNNISAEQNTEDSLESISQRAYQTWVDALSKVKVESPDTARLTTFYSALYHSFFHPNVFSDANGEYAGFDGKTHKIKASQKNQYANFSGWDVYRSQLQLVSLTHPQRANDIAQSLLNQSEQYNGIWDRWTHNNGPTGVMNGDPSTIAMANFVAFGCDGFDVTTAYQSLVKAATVPTEYDLSNIGAPVFTRGQKPSLDQWLNLKFISDSCNAWDGATETLEQASAYFALSQFSQRLKHADDNKRFLEQSGYWKNLYNPEAAFGVGYVQGKNADGSWKEHFDPYSPHLFVEGSPSQYLWMVPFDAAGLIEKMGGPDTAAYRLDRFFRKENGAWALYRSGGQYSDVSNQPSINAPWMYLYTGKAYKAQEVLRATMDHLWRPTTTGIPGQDDLGQMSSWYVFSALGLYPHYPGRADLLIGSPVFPKARIERAAGGHIDIETINNSNDNIYVQSLTVNGEQTNKSWITEDYIKNGVSLKLVMSQEVNPAFGDINNVPPSFSTK